MCLKEYYVKTVVLCHLPKWRKRSPALSSISGKWTSHNEKKKSDNQLYQFKYASETD